MHYMFFEMDNFVTADKDVEIHRICTGIFSLLPMLLADIVSE